MVKTFKIGERVIGEGQPVFMVAELSGNHHQKYEEAEALVRAAKEAGADAVKLQTYTADTITLNSDKEWFRVGGEADNPELWKGKTLYQLYQTAYTPWDWQPKLKKLADELGVLLFSSPFDTTAVDFLEKMDVLFYKIASYEVNDCTILKRVAQTGKPVIMSIGYASVEDVELALKTLRENGSKDIAILYCITDYKSEADEDHANLATIQDIAKRWGVVVGFSDNSGGIDVPAMAMRAGAAIVEKHIILDRKLGGPDADFSLEPAELKELVEILHGQKKYAFDEERYQKVFGKPNYGPRNDLEKYNLRWRRSLFVAKDIKKGEKFTAENIRSVRPAFGLHTKYFDELLGKTAATDIEFATPLKKEHIADNLTNNEYKAGNV
ncbi:MAG: pseudaminic acid synthase [bacterium]|nr:pseudaminic acid synthase [bacterium]